MKTFLEYVAEDIIKKYGYDLSRIAVIFPNKRASLFLNEYIVKTAGRPIWAPAYFTISDLFCRNSSLTLGDSIKLICDLHKSFMECTGIDETFDHFYGWGELLLADFDDIDKNMADAKTIFTNLKDIHELDDISYLTSEQKETLQRFFSNFSEDQNTILKKRFMQLWSNMGNIYEDYKDRLRRQNIAYEGMLYRDVAQDEDIEYEYDMYLFVGFNMVQTAEQKIFDRLQHDGKARFYWDFDNYYMPDRTSTVTNEAGRYISEYLKYYPNELPVQDADIYDNMSKDKSIAYINAGTENIQARYISRWLRENDRMASGKRTATVLCNESLLQTAVYCLPDEVEKINITAGFPLSQSPLSSLVARLMSLYVNGYNATRKRFSIQYIIPVITHPYARYISPKCKDLYKKLRNGRGHVLSVEELSCDDGLDLIFGIDENENILAWINRIIRQITGNSENADPFFQEALFCIYTQTNRLITLMNNGDLVADNVTLQRLVQRLADLTTIPFHGEPAVNIQIMGMLETRNLDFDHLLVLSCNEGDMPKNIGDSSFIPYSIRKAYGLTTIDNKVLIYAYYFNRLLQRAKDITLVYNSSTEDGHTGEMSRFMMQLMVESRHRISRYALHSRKDIYTAMPEPVEKTPEVMERLREIKYLSPTAMNNYMRCPLRFYYNNVANIKESESIDEEIDNRTLGNIFHLAAEMLYKSMMGSDGLVTKECIENVLKSRRHIEDVVDKAFKQEFFKIGDNVSRRVEYNGLQLISREVIIRYILRLLEIDKALSPFHIISLEGDVFETITVEVDDEEYGIKVGGRVDRLDMISCQDSGRMRIRVIDYKTGGKSLDKTPLNVEEVFDPSLMREKHTDYYFQAMLYSVIIRDSRKYNAKGCEVSPALLFIQHTGADGYDPTLCMGKEKITDIKMYAEEFRFNIRALIKEIYSKEVPFEPTADNSNCAFCPYKQLCGS